MIAYTGSLDSPFGPMVCAVDHQGAVIVVEFTTEQSREEILATLEEEGYELEESEERTADVRRQLRDYLSGERRDFHLPLAMRGTPFQREVWQMLRSIPFGETRTYRQISESISRPRATRAVGAASGANRIAVVIPCHRVVGTDGSLTGYAGGIEIKRWLLRHEKTQ